MNLPEGFELFDDEGRLSLRFPDSKVKPLTVDFLSSAMRFRQKSNATKNQLIARAIGVKASEKSLNRPLRVIDATLGLGTDSFVLASLGCQIFGIERSEVVFRLVEDGFRRASEGAISIFLGEAKALLPKLVGDHAPDVIYLDPMFPHSKKSALAGKEMQALQALLRALPGDDARLAGLALDLLAKGSVRRVVIKRPLTAAPLVCEPTNRLQGKSIRFDVYL